MEEDYKEEFAALWSTLFRKRRDADKVTDFQVWVNCGSQGWVLYGRADAFRLGYELYYDGVCLHGHHSAKRVVDGVCVICHPEVTVPRLVYRVPYKKRKRPKSVDSELAAIDEQS